MPALEITRSMLVNHGLSAASATAHLAAVEPETENIISSDRSLDAFKKLVLQDSVRVVDHDFTNVLATFTTPLDLATWTINAKYNELGGAGGVLGATTTAVVATSNNAGFMRSFQHGVIYWHANFGAHALHGPVLVRWRELGAEKGFLGFPTSDVTPGADVRAEGVFAHFQGGSIYWTKPHPVLTAVATSVAHATLATNVGVPADTAPAPMVLHAAANAHLTATTAAHANGGAALGGAAAATAVGRRPPGAFDATVVLREPPVSSAGAFEVHGAIREKYLALGAEASILGYPTTNETTTPDGIGRYNHFQGGSIYWTPSTWAHEVHGLIRDRWASLGWERNPQLGYPITDELTPERRVGHRRPEVRKKPVAALPSGVIKLPADAAGADIPRAVVNLPPATTVLHATRIAPAAAPASVAASARTSVGAVGRLSDRPLVLPAEPAAGGASVAHGGAAGPAIHIDPNLVVVAMRGEGASTEAAQRSQNRFADFENGVLFWFRGAPGAITLGSIAATSDGTDVSFSGADIANTALAKIGRPNLESNNAALASMTFIGTTGYSFDGVQVHNRRHRLQMILQGMEVQHQGGIFHVPVPVPVTASVELQVEVFFDAAQRRIALALTDWNLTHAASPGYGAAVSAALRAKLDPLLWTSFDVVTLPDTDAGDPIAVLSVKTLPNGAVATFVEPHTNLAVRPGEVINAVHPVITVFTPQQ